MWWTYFNQEEARKSDYLVVSLFILIMDRDELRRLLLIKTLQSFIISGIVFSSVGCSCPGRTILIFGWIYVFFN